MPKIESDFQRCRRCEHLYCVSRTLPSFGTAGKEFCGVCLRADQVEAYQREQQRREAAERERARLAPPHQQALPLEEGVA